ncbi:hypothetical protein [Marinicellulosiphila megalodicopiae]|uniref:hypothetical protein n=1 Tax=Marinicellulosiphila megalodicopiae TaxID=2724896 RepID=UPI003BB054F0
MLKWDETEFIECLESIPEEIVDELVGNLYIFNVTGNGIQLELKVYPKLSDVSIKIININDKSIVFEYYIFDCESVNYQKLINDDERLRFISSAGIEIYISTRPNINVRIK